MNFKNYEREYERVFSGIELINKKCDLDKVSVLNDEYSSFQYVNMIKDLTGEFDAMTFDFLVKYYWLIKKFCYRGYNRKNLRRNGNKLDMAFGVFMRYHVGFDSRMVMHSGSWFGKIATYFEELFPAFDQGNPFEEKYEYPYKVMNLACLFLVYQMDERFDLLKHGEKQKMNYAKFSDYVLNYINCLNEDLGEDHYLFIYSHRIAPYIKKNDYGKV